MLIYFPGDDALPLVMYIANARPYSPLSSPASQYVRLSRVCCKADNAGRGARTAAAVGAEAAGGEREGVRGAEAAAAGDEACALRVGVRC